jgi:hypothetical protein
MKKRIVVCATSDVTQKICARHWRAIAEHREVHHDRISAAIVLGSKPHHLVIDQLGAKNIVESNRARPSTSGLCEIGHWCVKHGQNFRAQGRNKENQQQGQYSTFHRVSEVNFDHTMQELAENSRKNRRKMQPQGFYDSS